MKPRAREQARPEPVLATIQKAVQSERPRTRYTVPAFPGVAFGAIAKFLPTRAADAIIRRSTDFDG